MMGTILMDPAIVGWFGFALGMLFLCVTSLAAYLANLRHKEREDIRLKRDQFEARDHDRLNLEIKKAAFDLALQYASLYNRMWEEGRWDRETAPPFNTLFDPKKWMPGQPTPEVTLEDRR